MMAKSSRNGHGYTLGEEIANAITHGMGWFLSAAGLGVLLTLGAINGTAIDVVAVLIFGLSLILMYGASTLYHALPYPRAKKFFKAFDHAAIYILIAGTYTPLCLVNLKGVTGWTLFALIWSLAFAGLVFSIFRPGKRILELGLYLGMGWAAVVVFPKLIGAINPVGLKLLIAGGLCYTIGVIFYVLKKLPYGHMVWHLFVLAGSTLHFLAIVFGVLVRDGG